MINKTEFRKMVGKDVVNVDKAYDLYKSLAKKDSMEEIKKILALDEKGLSRLRNSMCETHLIEISPMEMKDLIKILELIYDNENDGEQAYGTT